MGVTFRDVAALAGVSPSTVSRCFTEGASISAKTRARIEKAADQLGYRPNALASSLTTGRTKLVGLVSDNFQNPIFLEVFDRFTRGLQDRGLRPLLVNLSHQTDPASSVRMLQQYSVDAAIVASSTLPVEFAESFEAAGIPVVHSFGRYAEKPRVNVVTINNFEAGRMAARALVDCGYQRIAMLAGPGSATSTQDRLAGFLEAMDAEPNVAVSTSYARAYSFDAGWDAMRALIAEGDLAEAYFCGDDVLSIGALSALEDAGYRVPDDVGILGFNDMEMARWRNIDLSTIHQPIDEIVRLSIESVGNMLSSPVAMAPRAHLLSCRIVHRGTLKTARG
ncbi:MAG: LacI family DNA-binding transcriptional regulator [Pseudomonadota bacterium]